MARNWVIAFFSLVSIFSCQSKVSVASIKLDSQSFKDSVKGAGIQFVDVRKPKEFNESHINGAINIDFLSEDFSDVIKNLNKEKPVYIYCRSGKRSAKSAVEFEKIGFTKIYELEGGFINWRKAGFVVNPK